jgi:hypothetical protein
MNLTTVNDQIKQSGYPNLVIDKIRKSRQPDNKYPGCLIYYVHVPTQPLHITQVFRQKYPKLNQYNNRLIFLSQGFLTVEFST